MVKGLENYTDEEIIQTVDDELKFIIDQYDLDIYILGYYLHGSRVFGNPRPNSDLDIVVEYSGSLKEYMVYNIFNEEGFEIEGIKIDINPIRKEETGTLEEYKEKDKNYKQK